MWQKLITKRDSYYKVRQNLLQNMTSITNCDKKLLQSEAGITKWEVTTVLNW